MILSLGLLMVGTLLFGLLTLTIGAWMTAWEEEWFRGEFKMILKAVGIAELIFLILAVIAMLYKLSQCCCR